MGLRNLIIIMLLGTLGLRTSTLTALNIEDIDITCGLLLIREKGRRLRSVVLPHSLCKIICNYLQLRRRKRGPLLISKRKKRISPRTLQDIFRTAADQLGIDKKLHARLFRHTAATHLWRASHLNDNNVDILIIQNILGHSSTRSTEPYIHPSHDSIRRAMEKLPGIKLVKELIRKGELNLRFQKPFRSKRE